MTDMTPNFDADCVVIGAGVIGLAIARMLAMSGREVLIVEKGLTIGAETSSRNSEVIHAGIYYPKDSLKALDCVRGRDMLYEFLESRSVPYRKCGKFIVAANEQQVDELGSIARRASDNGVSDLCMIDMAACKAAEPALKAMAALVSPSTGIIDSHAYMLSLLGEAEDHGASVAYKTEITSGDVLSDGRTRLRCVGEEDCVITANLVINSAGLSAPVVASRIEGLKPDAIPKAYFAKGNYFTLASRAPFSRLIYPVPEPGGLGVHLTLDLGGQARFGPDVEWIDEVAYEVDPARADIFYSAIRAYWPGLPDQSLRPDYAGIRPKISAPGAPNADFVISGPEQHGAEGQIHLFGIESPGLTASLAIADRVGDMLS